MVDLRRIARCRAERRLLLRAVAGASSAASTMLTLRTSSWGRAASSVCSLSHRERGGVRGYGLSIDPIPLTPTLSPSGRGSAPRLSHHWRATHDASVFSGSGRRHPAKTPAAARDGDAARLIDGRRHASAGSGPHEAFDFAFRPGERLVHRLALHEPDRKSVV